MYFVHFVLYIYHHRRNAVSTIYFTTDTVLSKTNMSKLQKARERFIYKHCAINYYAKVVVSKS